MVSENKNSTALFSLVTSHYLVSAICFLILTIMLFFSADVFAGHYFQPRLLAITHMAALGWGTLLIFGSTYQLLVFVLETELFSKKLAWVTFFLFVPGLGALVSAFWAFDPGITMQFGSVLLLISVFLFVINVYRTVRKNTKQSIHDDYVLTSCWWLGFTAVLGVLMVFNFRFPFLPQDHLQFLRLHAHMGAVGWFLLLIIGVSTKLVPMFMASAYQNTRLLNWSFYLINGALLLFLVDTFRSGINLKTFGILAVGISGIAGYLIYIYKCFSSRTRRSLDLPMVQTLFSFILLSFAVLTLPFLIHYFLKNDPLSIRFTLLYGTLVFLGWITSLILGQTFKTLPFIVWVKYYQQFSGNGKRPLPENLVRNNLLRIQAVAFLLFCIMFFTGQFLVSDTLMKAALVSLMVTAAFYIITIVSVMLHPLKSAGNDHI